MLYDHYLEDNVPKHTKNYVFDMMNTMLFMHFKGPDVLEY